MGCRKMLVCREKKTKQNRHQQTSNLKKKISLNSVNMYINIEHIRPIVIVILMFIVEKNPI